MKLFSVTTSVFALYLHNLSCGQGNIRSVPNRSSNDKGKMEEVLDLENVHLEKEVKVVKELDFEEVKHEGQAATLERDENLGEVVKMQMKEFVMETKKIEMKDTIEVLEVENMVKSEKTNMAQENGNLDAESDQDKTDLLEEEDECWKDLWCAICETIHTFVIPAISLCGLLGLCFLCLIVDLHQLVFKLHIFFSLPFLGSEFQSVGHIQNLESKAISKTGNCLSLAISYFLF